MLAHDDEYERALHVEEMTSMVGSKTLRVSPNSELSLLLHEALKSGESVVVDTGEVVYRLGVESPESVTPTLRRPSPEEVERSRAGIREAAGTWRDIDADAFKAYIRERCLPRPPSAR